MSRKNRIRSAFDRAAGSYDRAAWLQQDVARHLEKQLTAVETPPSVVLDLGCGTGSALAVLRTRFPQARLIGLDFAFEMAARAHRRSKPSMHVENMQSHHGPQQPHLICADMERLPIKAGSVDLVWSSLALQWADKPDIAFGEIRRILIPGGQLLFSSLGPDTLKELRAAFGVVDAYTHVNRFHDIQHLRELLIAAGFNQPILDRKIQILAYENVKSLLRDLKSIGAQTIVTGPPRRGLMSRDAWQRLEDNYERLRQSGRLPATYEVIYGHCCATEVNNA
jgi:malonyl-CoA O-methyltransferase